MNQKRKKKARNRGGLSLSMEGPDSVSTTSMVDTLADTCGHSGHRAAAMMYMMEAARPKPKWDVHLGCARNRAESLAEVPRPLIAGPSGSGDSPHPSGWPARRGIG